MKLKFSLLNGLLVAWITLAWLPVQAQTLDQLPPVNSFAVTSGPNAWVYAATQGGLFISRDGGENWNDSLGFRFPVTLVESTDDGMLYVFAVTRGLLRLGKSDSDWVTLNNQFGGQVLTKLTVISGTSPRFFAHNQYRKVLSSSNGGKTWSGSMGGKGPVSDREKRGEKLYVAKCQSCHGVQGVGETYSEEALTKQGYIIAPALDDSTHAWHHTDDQLVKTILEGSDRTERMKAWKEELSEKDAREVVAYMKSLWGQRALGCQGPKHMQCM